MLQAARAACRLGLFCLRMIGSELHIHARVLRVSHPCPLARLRVAAMVEGAKKKKRLLMLIRNAAFSDTAAIWPVEQDRKALSNHGI